MRFWKKKSSFVAQSKIAHRTPVFKYLLKESKHKKTGGNVTSSIQFLPGLSLLKNKTKRVAYILSRNLDTLNAPLQL